MRPFDFQLRTRVVFGDGTLARLPDLARELSFTRVLLVADRGMVSTGQVARAAALLEGAGIASHAFHDFDSNPDDVMVESGRVFAAARGVDSIVAIGGGSSLDCAKGINFVVTNGGTMRDYRGFGKATRPMLPAPSNSSTRPSSRGATSRSTKHVRAKRVVVAEIVAVVGGAIGAVVVEIVAVAAAGNPAVRE